MTLQFQRQGYAECFPTTIAMLAGIDKDVLIVRALTHFGVSTWRHLWHFFGKDQEVADFIVNAAGLSGYGLSDWSILFPNGTTPAKVIEIPEGKGLMVVEGPHAVAFADGLIYDPDEDRPMTADEYSYVHPDRSVLRVIRVE